MPLWTRNQEYLLKYDRAAHKVAETIIYNLKNGYFQRYFFILYNFISPIHIKKKYATNTERHEKKAFSSATIPTNLVNK